MHLKLIFCRGNSGGKIVPDKSTIVVAAIRRSDVRPGDLILFDKGFPICHRVLRTRFGKGLKVELFTKGDGCLLSDGWISPSECLGKVLEVNSTPVTKRSFRIRSRIYYWHSKLGWFVFERFLASEKPGINRLAARLGIAWLKILQAS